MSQKEMKNRMDYRKFSEPDTELRNSEQGPFPEECGNGEAAHAD